MVIAYKITVTDTYCIQDNCNGHTESTYYTVNDGYCIGDGSCGHYENKYTSVQDTYCIQDNCNGHTENTYYAVNDGYCIGDSCGHYENKYTSVQDTYCVQDNCNGHTESTYYTVNDGYCIGDSCGHYGQSYHTVYYPTYKVVSDGYCAYISDGYCNSDSCTHQAVLDSGCKYITDGYCNSDSCYHSAILDSYCTYVSDGYCNADSTSCTHQAVLDSGCKYVTDGYCNSDSCYHSAILDSYCTYVSDGYCNADSTSCTHQAVLDSGCNYVTDGYCNSDSCYHSAILDSYCTYVTDGFCLPDSTSCTHQALLDSGCKYVTDGYCNFDTTCYHQEVKDSGCNLVYDGYCIADSLCAPHEEVLDSGCTYVTDGYCNPDATCVPHAEILEAFCKYVMDDWPDATCNPHLVKEAGCNYVTDAYCIADTYCSPHPGVIGTVNVPDAYCIYDGSCNRHFVYYLGQLNLSCTAGTDGKIHIDLNCEHADHMYLKITDPQGNVCYENVIQGSSTHIDYSAFNPETYNLTSPLTYAVYATARNTPNATDEGTEILNIAKDATFLPGLEPIFNGGRVLEYGMTGDDVAQLQKMLSNIRDANGDPYLSGSYTQSVFDTATLNAVNKYKEDHNLVNTTESGAYGKVDRPAWDSLLSNYHPLVDPDTYWNNEYGYFADGWWNDKTKLLVALEELGLEIEESGKPINLVELSNSGTLAAKRRITAIQAAMHYIGESPGILTSELMSALQTNFGDPYLITSDVIYQLIKRNIVVKPETPGFYNIVEYLKKYRRFTDSDDIRLVTPNILYINGIQVDIQTAYKYGEYQATPEAIEQALILYYLKKSETGVYFEKDYPEWSELYDDECLYERDPVGAFGTCLNLGDQDFPNFVNTIGWQWEYDWRRKTADDYIDELQGMLDFLGIMVPGLFFVTTGLNCIIDCSRGKYLSALLRFGAATLAYVGGRMVIKVIGKMGEKLDRLATSAEVEALIKASFDDLTKVESLLKSSTEDIFTEVRAVVVDGDNMLLKLAEGREINISEASVKKFLSQGGMSAEEIESKLAYLKIGTTEEVTEGITKAINAAKARGITNTSELMQIGKATAEALETTSLDVIRGMTSFSDELSGYLNEFGLSKAQFEAINLTRPTLLNATESEISAELSSGRISLEEYNNIMRVRPALEGYTLEQKYDMLRKVINIREMVDPITRDTLMTKAFPEADGAKMLNNEGYYSTLKGFTGRAQDTNNMLTYNDFYYDYRLDYTKADGTPGFNPQTDNGMYILRYTTNDIANIKVPYGGLTAEDKSIIESITNKVVDGQYTWPYTGDGFTAATNGTVNPEFVAETPVNLKYGSSMYYLDKATGKMNLAGWFDGENWIRLSN